MTLTPTPTRIRLAWLVAILTDAIQIGLLTVTGPLVGWVGAPLDVAAMLLLWLLIGWHWALLPTFIFELVPMVLPIAELAPTWTLATWIVLKTRNVPLPELPGPLGTGGPEERPYLEPIEPPTKSLAERSRTSKD